MYEVDGIAERSSQMTDSAAQRDNLAQSGRRTNAIGVLQEIGRQTTTGPITRLDRHSA
jgi:hypothetical protein